ncbi:unnamed protein product [Closterium sp. Naga37s-1]|nr:unnamed protein product [Closterium sp. Naga37s-1]
MLSLTHVVPVSPPDHPLSLHWTCLSPASCTPSPSRGAFLTLPSAHPPSSRTPDASSLPHVTCGTHAAPCLTCCSLSHERYLDGYLLPHVISPTSSKYHSSAHPPALQTHPHCCTSHRACAHSRGKFPILLSVGLPTSPPAGVSSESSAHQRTLSPPRPTPSLSLLRLLPPLAEVSSLPHELQRMLSLMRELSLFSTPSSAHPPSPPLQSCHHSPTSCSACSHSCEVSSLPHELQRMLSLMRELDGRCQALRMEIQSDIRAGLTAIEEREAALRAADAGPPGHGDGDGEGDESGGDDDDAASEGDADDDGNGEDGSEGGNVTVGAAVADGGSNGAADGATDGCSQGTARDEADGLSTQVGNSLLLGQEGMPSPAPGSEPAVRVEGGILAGKGEKEAGGGGERRPRGRPRKRGRGEREGVDGEGFVGGMVKVEEEVEEGGGRKSIGKKRPRAQQHQVGQQQQQQQVGLQQEEEERKGEAVVVKAELSTMTERVTGAAVTDVIRASAERVAGGLEEEGAGRDGRDDVDGDVSDEREAALRRLREEISEKQGKMRALCDEKVILAQQVSALVSVWRVVCMFSGVCSHRVHVQWGVQPSCACSVGCAAIVCMFSGVCSHRVHVQWGVQPSCACSVGCAAIVCMFSGVCSHRQPANDNDNDNKAAMAATRDFGATNVGAPDGYKFQSASLENRLSKRNTRI